MVCVMALATASARGATAPKQPPSGPGGTDYPHAKMTWAAIGEGGRQVWVFQPSDPTTPIAPVVVFNHGWAAMSPNIYGAWIRHLVRRGNIVIFPRYQANIATAGADFMPNAVAGVKAAIEQLQASEGVKPDLDRFAVVGHSVGGVLTANFAAMAEAEGLPKVRAAMSVQPGGSRLTETRQFVPLADMSKIPAATLLLVVVGDLDVVVGDRDARRIYTGATQVAAGNKSMLRFVTDVHGLPPLIADHNSPAAMGRVVPFGGQEGEPRGGIAEGLFDRFAETSVNALDTHGYWRLFDALCAAAFEGDQRDLALGGGEKQLSMGQWSDGKPIKPLVVVEPR